MPCWRITALVATVIAGTAACRQPAPESSSPAVPQASSAVQSTKLDPVAVAETQAHLVGRWTGALVDDRGLLRIEVEVERGDDGRLRARPEVPDWFGYDALDPAGVTVDEDGIAIEHLVYGPARLQMDLAFRQLVGEVESREGNISVHLKPSLPVPRGQPLSEHVRETSAGVDLDGTLWLPEGEGPHPAMLVIGGRGCYGRSQSLGRVLPDYGMAVLSYDKRGTGKSTGDCATATFDQLVEDAATMDRFLRQHPRVDPDSVGLWGGSAGAWTAQGLVAKRLEADALLPAFVVTWIGPGTSIAQQQRDSGAAIGASLGLDSGQLDLVNEALEISLDRSAPRAEVFARLREIESEIREQGWLDEMFEDTDFPQREADVDLLWVRRFSFDPGPVLARMGEIPYLAVLGEQDPVVPFEINAAALRDSGHGGIRVIGIPGVGHGFEHGDQRSRLPDGSQYFKFDTVEPMFFTETIRFLRDIGVLPR